MTIRVVTDADLDEILEHNNAAVPAVNTLERSHLEWFVEKAHSFLVAPADDGTVAGYLIGLAGPGVDYDSENYEWFSARYDRFIYVDRIVVAEGGRGKGLGWQLYDAFADRGRADGYELLLAEVNVKPRNDGSLRFHDRYGFISVGKQDTEGGTKRVTLLEKPLYD